MAVARSIAVVHGTAITPGVSRNGRYYTAEHIKGAVTRAQVRISDGTATVRDLGTHPMAQRTHHAADDDSTSIVGRLTSLVVAEDGSARYTAELADTGPARTILSLIDTSDGRPPFLRGVSIRGAWLGEVRRITHEGRVVETGDGLDIDGLDYTQNPGVTGAVVDRVDRLTDDNTAETVGDRRQIFESVDARVDPVDERGAPALKSGKPAAAPTRATKYADPGYQDDRAPRYALDTRTQAKAAWSYIHQAKNAKLYTAPQLKRIKGRIKAALSKFGVKVADEGWLVDPVTQVTETVAVSEDYGDTRDSGGSFRICMTNGPTTVTVSSYCVDPADLEVVGHAAMAGAVSAITGLDPDLDGDVDVPGAATEDTGDSMESTVAGVPAITEQGEPDAPTASGTVASDGGSGVSATPAPVPAATNQIEEEPDVSEPTPPVEPTPTEPTTTSPPADPPPAAEPTTPAPAAAPSTPAGVLLTDGQFTALLAALRREPVPAETAPVAPVAETTPPTPAAVDAAPAVTETDDQRISRLVREALPLAVQEHVQAHGLPGRKGLVAKRPPVTETDDTDPDLGEFGVPEGWPQKPLNKYTDAERTKYISPAVQAYVLGGR